MTDSGGRLRLLPRTNGITQYEQRELHPSRIFRVGRVWLPSPPRTGAASRAFCSRMSPLRIFAGRGESNMAVGARAAAGKKPFKFEAEDISEIASISAGI